MDSKSQPRLELAVAAAVEAMKQSQAPSIEPETHRETKYAIVLAATAAVVGTEMFAAVAVQSARLVN